MRYFLSVLILTSSLLAVQTITYTAPRGDEDKRYEYNIALLKAALEVTKEAYGDYSMQPSSYGDVSRKRQIALVESGKMTITWAPASDELQEQLSAIKIPIFKGLLGYRFFFVNDSEKEKFASVKSLEELKKLTMCTGHGWGVTKLYTHHGFKTLISPAYEGLFEMIEQGRADYFSRGINEIFKEYEARKDKYPKLHIDTHLSLYHPLPFYTYLPPTKEGKALAQRVEKGFHLLIQSGEFERLFQKYHGELLADANLGERTMFSVDNPFLPKDVPYDKKEYWIDVTELKKEKPSGQN